WSTAYKIQQGRFQRKTPHLSEQEYIDSVRPEVPLGYFEPVSYTHLRAHETIRKKKEEEEKKGRASGEECREGKAGEDPDRFSFANWRLIRHWWRGR
ncbi:hypothetical protein, partial [Marinobacter sp. bablab_jr008]|uniref:hypothetical protein n=1 Tax=Marinobacter sp. bablab_jr008 TaxID=2755064 RepID=UPI001A7F0138